MDNSFEIVGEFKANTVIDKNSMNRKVLELYTELEIAKMIDRMTSIDHLTYNILLNFVWLRQEIIDLNINVIKRNELNGNEWLQFEIHIKVKITLSNAVEMILFRLDYIRKIKGKI